MGGVAGEFIVFYEVHHDNFVADCDAEEETETWLECYEVSNLCSPSLLVKAFSLPNTIMDNIRDGREEGAVMKVGGR